MSRRKRKCRWYVTTFKYGWWYKRGKWVYIYKTKDLDGPCSSHAYCRTKKKALRLAEQLNNQGLEAVLLQYFYRKGVRCLQQWIMEPRRVEPNSTNQ